MRVEERWLWEGEVLIEEQRMAVIMITKERVEGLTRCRGLGRCGSMVAG